LFTLSIPGIVKPNGAEMFGFILCIIRISLLPLSSTKKELMARILLLQKENTILKRSLEAKRKRARFNFGDRMFYSILNRITDKTRYHITLVKPETVLKWIRRFTKGYWRFPQKKKEIGRPETSNEIKQLVLSMKNKNICWGNGKIQGELEKLGIKLDKRTIARIIEYFRRKGRVRKGLTWSKFIQSHLSSLYGMDFFTLDTILEKCFYVFFIIHLQTRQIVRYAVSTNPTREFVRQQLIEFTWDLNGEKVYLIHDGSGEFCNINYDDLGIEGIKISANAPNMNAFAERFICSARREAFNWFILFNGAQIRNILDGYVEYYNEKRPHQGIAQKVPGGYTPQKQGKVITYPILSGLHHHYERVAA
jgi:hypothetical protein